VKTTILWGLITTGLILGLVGCLRNDVITHRLETDLIEKPTFYIGEFRDGLPADFPAHKKPTARDISIFISALKEALYENRFAGEVSVANPGGKDYEITGAILDYKRGDGFLRFFSLGHVGRAKATMKLELRNMQTKDIIFAGIFGGYIVNWDRAGDEMYSEVSKAFVKALRKEIRKIRWGK